MDAFDRLDVMSLPVLSKVNPEAETDKAPVSRQSCIPIREQRPDEPEGARTLEGARVAVVHDWLYTIGGAERVLAAILQCFPKADLFCLFDVLNADQRRQLGGHRSTTSFLQNAPFIRRHHRAYLPLMPVAISQLDLSGYDVVISSSYAVARGILTGPDQLHISYVHSPMRYAWDLQHEYLRQAGLKKGFKELIALVLLHNMRIWDAGAASVDAYIANSRFVARRVGKFYSRSAVVIPPPVNVPAAAVTAERETFFLTAGRLVGYKNTHVVVDAFAHLPDQRLIVVGDGPERRRLEARATSNVEFRGAVGDDELHGLMSRARAFIFAGVEDFGITPVEAQGRGAPVLALGRGGARETIITEGAKPTGMFFNAPEPAAVVDVVRRFLARRTEIDPLHCHENARRFSEERFRQDFVSFAAACYARFLAGSGGSEPEPAWIAARTVHPFASPRTSPISEPGPRAAVRSA